MSRQRDIRRIGLLTWLAQGEGRYVWWPIEFLAATPYQGETALRTRSGEYKARTRELRWARRHGLVRSTRRDPLSYVISEKGRRLVRCRLAYWSPTLRRIFVEGVASMVAP